MLLQQSVSGDPLYLDKNGKISLYVLIDKGWGEFW